MCWLFGRAFVPNTETVCACVYAECWNDNSIDNTKVLFKIVQNLSKNVLAGRWRLIQCAHCGRIIQFSNGTLELIMSVNGQYAQNYLQFIICKRIHFSKGDFRRFYMVPFSFIFVFIFVFLSFGYLRTSYIRTFGSHSLCSSPPPHQALVLILPKTVHFSSK